MNTPVHATFLYPEGSRCEVTHPSGLTTSGIIISTAYDPTHQAPTVTLKDAAGTQHLLTEKNIDSSKFFRQLDIPTGTPQISAFDALSIQELYAILKLRCDVFVVEQTCPYPELDNLDQQAIHVFLPSYAQPGCAHVQQAPTTEHPLPLEISSYLRVFPRSSEVGVVQIGRVVTAERGCGLGTRIMEQGLAVCKTILHAQEVYLEAQTYAQAFYEKFGFVVTGPEFVEDGIPHVPMRCKLTFLSAVC